MITFREDKNSNMNYYYEKEGNDMIWTDYLQQC